MMTSQRSVKTKSQQGIALIQVLLISTIISILAIRFSFTAREQINTASDFEQRIKATQKLKSIQSEIIYTLLTQDKIAQPQNMFPTSEPWNFYGKPFVIERIENNEHTDKAKTWVVIQNSQGLLSQQFIMSPLWYRVFQNMGYDEEQIKHKQGIIKDWQDVDNDSWLIGNTEPMTLPNGQAYRNQTIQLPHEIDWLFEGEPEKLNIIKQISTQYNVIGLNLLHAPDLLISLFFEPELVVEIIRQRSQNQLNKEQLITMLESNYDEELISFFPATRLKIKILVMLNDVQLQETIEIKLQPYKSEPVLILARY